jgi:hypothetical protein
MNIADHMPYRYEVIMRELAGADPAMLVAHLDNTLPAMWQADYLGMPGSTENLVTVTQGDASRTTAFCRHLFDHASDVSHVGPADSIVEDRVAAVWGTSRQVDVCTRDRARIRANPTAEWVARQIRRRFLGI